MFPYDETPKPKIPFNRIDDYSPDCRPSDVAWTRERVGEGSEEVIRYALVVRGEGVLVLTMTRRNKAIGVSMFTKDEIGYSDRF